MLYRRQNPVSCFTWLFGGGGVGYDLDMICRQKCNKSRKQTIKTYSNTKKKKTTTRNKANRTFQKAYNVPNRTDFIYFDYAKTCVVTLRNLENLICTFICETLNV